MDWHTLSYYCNLAWLPGYTITHATELVLDSPGFFRDFPPKQHLLDNWSGQVTDSKYFKYFKIEFEYTTSMEVDGPDLDALESDDQLLMHTKLANQVKSRH